MKEAAGRVEIDAVDCRSRILNSVRQLQGKVAKFTETPDSAMIAFKGVKQKKQTRADKVHCKFRRSREQSKETRRRLSSWVFGRLVCIADLDSCYVFLVVGCRSRRGWSGLGAGQSAAPQAATRPRLQERE